VDIYHGITILSANVLQSSYVPTSSRLTRLALDRASGQFSSLAPGWWRGTRLMTRWMNSLFNLCYIHRAPPVVMQLALRALALVYLHWALDLGHLPLPVGTRQPRARACFHISHATMGVLPDSVGFNTPEVMGHWVVGALAHGKTLDVAQYAPGQWSSAKGHSGYLNRCWFARTIQKTTLSQSPIFNYISRLQIVYASPCLSQVSNLKSPYQVVLHIIECACSART